MKFPHIEHIDQLKEKVGHMQEIRFMEQDNGFTVVCYMISDEDTFHGENAAWARECRGITFDRNGRIAGRPLHKFFNVGECEETQKYNLNWSEVVHVMDKRDGSMIHPVLVNGNVSFKSKKSFASDVAVWANQFGLIHNPKYGEFCRQLLKENLTPIFEYTAPNSRIVINYGSEPKLKLLHVRNNFTGEYYAAGMYSADEKLVDDLIDAFDIDYVDVVGGVHPADLLAELETVQGIEGYIFQFTDGNMVKAKSKWYLELHHSVTFPTYRSLAEMVLNETIDDYKSYLSQVGASCDMVNKIEHQIVSEMNEIEIEVERLYELNKNLERKEVALANKDHEYFSLLMQKYSGKEPDVKKFYISKYLKERFSIEQVGE